MNKNDWTVITHTCVRRTSPSELHKVIKLSPCLEELSVLSGKYRDDSKISIKTNNSKSI